MNISTLLVLIYDISWIEDKLSITFYYSVISINYLNLFNDMFCDSFILYLLDYDSSYS